MDSRKVLHTNSKYINFDGIKYFSNNHAISNRINYLLEKEKKLYQDFGVETFKDFKEVIRKLIPPNDRMVLLNFSADNLQKTLKKYSNRNNIVGQEVNLEFDFSKVEDIDISLIKNKKTIGKKISVNIDYTPTEIKKLMNKTFGTRFRTQNESTDLVNNFVYELLNKEYLTITTINKKTKQTEEIGIENLIKNYPWGYYKKDIELALKDPGGPLYNSLIIAQEEIKDLVFYELGKNSSQEMHKAIKRVWRANFGEKLSALNFFKGGETSKFISAVQGALGEFQTAIFFEYIKDKYPNLKSTQVSKIKGNILVDSEQGRTDVELFNSLGIQVKNIAIRGNLGVRDLGTTIHPGKFANSYLEEEKTDFLGFLANYYFNLTYQSENRKTLESLESYLGNRLGEIMNMTMQEKIEDTISFYFVDGQYLIPGSAILMAANNLKNEKGESLKDSVSITSGYSNAMTDEDFRKNKNYQDYWKNENGSWQPTNKNYAQYQNLINSAISIRTKFNLTELLMDTYKLI